MQSPAQSYLVSCNSFSLAFCSCPMVCKYSSWTLITCMRSQFRVKQHVQPYIRSIVRRSHVQKNGKSIHRQHAARGYRRRPFHTETSECQTTLPQDNSIVCNLFAFVSCLCLHHAYGLMHELPMRCRHVPTSFVALRMSSLDLNTDLSFSKAL